MYSISVSRTSRRSSICVYICLNTNLVYWLINYLVNYLSGWLIGWLGGLLVCQLLVVGRLFDLIFKLQTKWPRAPGAETYMPACCYLLFKKQTGLPLKIDVTSGHYIYFKLNIRWAFCVVPTVQSSGRLHNGATSMKFPAQNAVILTDLAFYH